MNEILTLRVFSGPSTSTPVRRLHLAYLRD